jgi:hypothetical protein
MWLFEQWLASVSYLLRISRYKRSFSGESVKPITYLGVTKREYFAAMALQGLLSTNSADVRNAARLAAYAADELIRALNE